MILGGILFVLGLCIGSFINSFLWRYQEKKTFKGRSMCPFCSHKIVWYDNIPLVSWFILSGRCRNCKKSISVQYPVVELLTGIIFTIVGIFSTSGINISRWLKNISTNSVILSRAKDLESIKLDSSVSSQNDAFLLLILFIIVSIMIMISVYDYKTKEIPNGFNLTFIILSATYLLVSSIGNQYNIHNTIYNILAGLLAFLFFWSLAYFSKETWMGGGDGKFALGMGLLLGPAGTFLAILIASVSGSVYGVTNIILNNIKLNRKIKLKINSLKSEIPFGPFLALGTFIALIFGPQIINFYVKIILGI